MSVKCPNCQKEYETAPNFCNACGAKIEQPVQQVQVQYQEPQPTQQPPQSAPAANADSNNKVLAALMYCFPILFFIALIQNPKDGFVMYHANQNLLRLILGVASSCIAIIPILGWIAVAVIGVFNCICFFLGLIAVFNGQMKPLPILGKYTLIQ